MGVIIWWQEKIKQGSVCRLFAFSNYKEQNAAVIRTPQTNCLTFLQQCRIQFPSHVTYLGWGHVADVCV